MWETNQNKGQWNIEKNYQGQGGNYGRGGGYQGRGGYISGYQGKDGWFGRGRGQGRA